jgi:hypothetical protein
MTLSDQFLAIIRRGKRREGSMVPDHIFLKSA